MAKLQRVIEEVLSKGINRIILVDNNSSNDIVKILNNDKIHLISFSRNYGTSKAISSALQYTLTDQATQFVLILDDDNLICNNFFTEIKEFWDRNNLDDEKGTCILAGMRVDKRTYLNTLQNRSNWIGINEKNAFWGLHIKQVIARLFKCLMAYNNYPRIKCSYEPLLVQNVAWGGMFFHKNVIQRIGLPNEDYHIFLDDYEYSNRIIEKGGRIILIPQCIIKDLDDNSEYLVSRFTSLIKHESPIRVYYAARNHFVFERNKRCDSLLVFYINTLLFITISLGISLFSLTFRNYIAMLVAIKDGYKNNLGGNLKYSLDKL